MRSFSTKLALFQTGLRKHDKNQLNQPGLVDSYGLVGGDYGLEAFEGIQRLFSNPVAIVDWPFPQLFKFTDATYLATRTALYSVGIDWSLTLEIGPVAEGYTWDAVDFQSFVAFTNGSVGLLRDVSTGVFSIASTVVFPLCLTMCNYNGQVIIGNTIEGTNWLRWSAIGSFNFTQDHSNEAGGMVLPSDCDILAVRQLGNKVIVYTSNSIYSLVSVSVPISTYALEELARYGILSKGAVGGGIRKHIFIDEFGQFRVHTPAGIGPPFYKEFFSVPASPLEPCLDYTPIVISGQSLITEVGTYNFTATGGVPPYTWTLSPATVGVSIVPSTGDLIITEEAVSGTFNVGCYDVCDGSLQEVSVVFTIIDPCADHIPIYISGVYNIYEAGTYQYTANGGVEPYIWSITPPVDGVTVNSATGLLTVADTVAEETITLSCSDICEGSEVSIEITLTGCIVIPAPIAAGPTILHNIGTYQYSATSGLAPYSWSVEAGDTAATINETTGLVTVPGDFIPGLITITCTDSCGRSDSIEAEITAALGWVTGGGVVGVESAEFFHSPDGISWTKVEQWFTECRHAIGYHNGLYVSGGGFGYIYTSPTGLAPWTQRCSFPPSVYKIKSSGSRVVAVGSRINGGQIATSENLVDWTVTTCPDGSEIGLQALYYDSVTQLWIIGTYAYGYVGPYIYTSPDGSTWTKRNNPLTELTPYGISAITRIGGQLVGFCFASQKTIVSSDGINWSTGALHPYVCTYDAVTGQYDGQELVICVNYPTSVITVSTTGQAWDPLDTRHLGVACDAGVENDHYVISYHNGIFVVSGGGCYKGSIHISEDGGNTWEMKKYEEGPARYLYGAFYGGPDA